MRVAIALFSFFALASCGYHLDKQGSKEGGAVPTFSKGQLSYALVNQYVFAPKCVQCHGRSGGVSLETYADVMRNLAAVEGTALRARSMPKSPVPPLTPSEAEILRSWIAAGAPEQPTGGTDLPPPAPLPPLTPTFASIHDRIFASKCLSCHRQGGSGHEVPLDTIADLVNSGDDLVIPGDAERSYLTVIISPGARRPMPPRSSGMSLITEEINIIKEWINNGARD